jgi:hypothetical protein
LCRKGEEASRPEVAVPRKAHGTSQPHANTRASRENKSARRRLGDLTRSDLIGLLVEKHAETVLLPGKEQKYDRLRDAVAVLGGSLQRHGFGGPLGETWILELGGKQITIRSADGQGFPLLDACFAKQSTGVLSVARGQIDPGGLAPLFKKLAEEGTGTG